jgi:trans-aconitate methyltransferase
VGVVPGSTLLFFADKLGYLCTGIDFSPRVHQLRDVFAARGVTAEFIQADFLTWNPTENFDLVYSCGFIEHFENYEQVIGRHWTLVRPGGLMLLTVPALSLVQMLSRKVFYEKAKMQEVLESHNLEIMNLCRLEQVVKGLASSEVLVASYTSEMEFWFRPKSPGVRWWTRPLFYPLRAIEKIVHLVGISSQWYSPVVLVLARKAY